VNVLLRTDPLELSIHTTCNTSPGPHSPGECARLAYRCIQQQPKKSS
jgi:hypothetical protein